MLLELFARPCSINFDDAAGDGGGGAARDLDHGAGEFGLGVAREGQRRPLGETLVDCMAMEDESKAMVLPPTVMLNFDA